MNLIESIGETMQMANEDVQSQHVVTVNRSKVMLGTSDFGGGHSTIDACLCFAYDSLCFCFCFTLRCFAFAFALRCFALLCFAWLCFALLRFALLCFALLCFA